MVKAPHTLNGKLIGCYYFRDDGRGIYLVQRRRRDVDRTKNAWLFDESTLESAKRQGICAIGVVCGSGANRKIWLTDIEDLYESPHAFQKWSETKQRGLPLTRFKINPYAGLAHIATSLSLR